MVLEATMIVIDNSEFMRNGDYTPSRFEAQSDAVTLIFSGKTQSNPENAVGLMTQAGSGPQVLATLTQDFGKILEGLHNTKIEGTSHLANAIQVASLALKHRQNKNQRQRIIVFVGSPIKEDTDELIKLAKRMKKNNVAIDFISFGQESENTEKLEKFIENVNSSDNSHLLSVSPGPHLLSDILVSSPIMGGSESGGTGGPSGSSAPAGDAGGGGNDYEFGVDPNLDPELALALRMSLEEEKARQERAKTSTTTTTGADDKGDSSSSSSSNNKPDQDKKPDDQMDMS